MKWKLFSTTFVLATSLMFVSNVDAATSRSRYLDAQKNDGCETSSAIGKGQGYGKEMNELPAGYSAPARINCECGWDVFVSGSFLYWLAAQDQMDLVSYQTGDTIPTVGIVQQKSKFKPGFKVALGTTFNHDDWMGILEYTRMHFGTSTKTAPPQSPAGGTMTSQPGWTDASLANTNTDSVTSKWKVNLDVIDGELNRWFYSGRMLTLAPFFGPRFGWLNQREAYTQYTGDNTTLALDNKIKSKSWFVGPRTGLDANFILGWGFRLTGSFAGSLLYQRIKTRASYVNSSNTLAAQMKASFKNITPNAEIGLGMGWGTYFMDYTWHFDLLAQYEFHYWWNQNAMRAAAYANQNVVAAPVPIKSGDLYYQGLTLTAKFDF